MTRFLLLVVESVRCACVCLIPIACLWFSGLVVTPCSLKSCINHALCASKSGSVECRCPDVRDCSAVKIPVCGSDGTTHKVYNNMCFMKVDSCRKGKRISPVVTEKCGEHWLRSMHSVFITLSVPKFGQLACEGYRARKTGTRRLSDRAGGFRPFKGNSIYERWKKKRQIETILKEIISNYR